MSSAAGIIEGSTLCPCGRGEAYEACCGPLHGGVPAPTAERLMRSRYCAFALGLEGYLLDSWHPSTRPATLLLDHEVRWLRLIVESTEAGGPFDRDGAVAFTAVGRAADGRFEQSERSRFTREGGHWKYLDGEG